MRSLSAVDRARDLGLDCAGIIWPERVVDGVRVGIDVVDVRTEERRRLAEVDNLPGAVRMGPYRGGYRDTFSGRMDALMGIRHRLPNRRPRRSRKAIGSTERSAPQAIICI